MRNEILISLLIGVSCSIACHGQKYLWYRTVPSDTTFNLELFKIEYSDDSLEIVLEKWQNLDTESYSLKLKYKLDDNLYSSISANIRDQDTILMLRKFSWALIRFERISENELKEEYIMHDGRIVDLHKTYETEGYSIDSIFNQKLNGKFLLSQVHYKGKTKLLEHYYLHSKKGPYLTSCYQEDTLSTEIRYFLNDGVGCYEYSELYIPMIRDDTFPGFEQLKGHLILTKALPELSPELACKVNNGLNDYMFGFANYFISLSKRNVDVITKESGSTFNGTEIDRTILKIRQ